MIHWSAAGLGKQQPGFGGLESGGETQKTSTHAQWQWRNGQANGYQQSRIWEQTCTKKRKRTITWMQLIVWGILQMHASRFFSSHSWPGVYFPLLNGRSGEAPLIFAAQGQRCVAQWGSASVLLSTKSFRHSWVMDAACLFEDFFWEFCPQNWPI